MYIGKFMKNGPTDENLSHFLPICEHFISHDSTRRFTKIGVKQINDVKNTVHV